MSSSSGPGAVQDQTHQDLMADRNPSPVLRVSVDGELLYANLASEALLRSWCDGEVCRYGDPVPEQWKRWAIDAIASGSPMQVQIDHAGRHLAFEITPDPGRVYVNLYARDITAQRTAEAARDRLVAAVQAASEAIIITDSHGVIRDVNPATTDLTGLGFEELLGRLPTLLVASPDDEALVFAAWDEAGRGGRWQGHLQCRHNQGGLWTANVSLAPIINQQGRVEHIVAVYRDVTEQIRLQEALRQSSRLEAIGQLAGAVAHDFNNLLTIISASADYLAEEFAPDTPQGELIEMVASAASRATALTRQILSFSRKRAVQLQVLDLSGVVQDVEKMLRRLMGERVRFATRLSPQPARILADAGQIEQVIINLAINARDAMPEGGELTVSVTLLPDDDQDQPGRVQLAVEDTGLGMETAVRSRIFEPFFTTKPEGIGTGLGLATVLEIVHRYDGEIGCVSEPGQGTMFSIAFPYADATKVTDPVDDAIDELSGAEQILLVEDDPTICRLLLQGLRGFGYRVLAAADGEQALRLAADPTCAVDLLVTDLGLPDTSGLDLAERLLELRPELPVILISGYGELADRRESLPARMTFLQKPFTATALAHRIRRCLATSDSV